jgi:hypothetical protein
LAGHVADMGKVNILKILVGTFGRKIIWDI